MGEGQAGYEDGVVTQAEGIGNRPDSQSHVAAVHTVAVLQVEGQRSTSCLFPIYVCSDSLALRPNVVQPTLHQHGVRSPRQAFLRRNMGVVIYDLPLRAVPRTGSRRGTADNHTSTASLVGHRPGAYSELG